MSLRDWSWFIAGVLMTVAVKVFLFSPSDSIALAPRTTTPAPATANVGSLDEVTQKLATRLATTGGSDSEWTLLAQSYDYMGRPADAAAARSHIANAPLTGASAASGSATLDSQTMAVVANALNK